MPMFKRASRPPASSNIRRQRGLAIGLILAAVALVAAIGLTLTLGARAGAATSETGADTALASTLIEQATTLKTASLAAAVRNGTAVGTNNLNTSALNYPNSDVGTYNLYDGATEPQTPPAQAFAASAQPWVNVTLQVNGVGTGGASWMFGLDGLKQDVCAQINRLLTGYATIPAVSVPVSFSGTSSYNFSGQASLNGDYEICFVDSSGAYHYYKTLRAN